MTSNIISNDCVGAYIYRDCLKTDNLNPFVWCSIDIENFSKLIENYDNINFKNIKCDLITNNSGVCKLGSLTPKIVIDNIVDVNYFHYIYDKSIKSPTSRSGYTICEGIVSYTIGSYYRRLNRMSGEPSFIWDVTKIDWYNKGAINPFDLFSKIKTNYDIIIHQPGVLAHKENNIIFINKQNDCFEVNTSARNIYNNLNNN